MYILLDEECESNVRDLLETDRKGCIMRSWHLRVGNEERDNTVDVSDGNVHLHEREVSLSLRTQCLVMNGNRFGRI